MADYDDIDQINKLHAEQAILHQALVILDDHDGIVSSYMVVPGDGAVGVMPVNVLTVEPKQNLMAAAHAYATQRYNTINQELRDLGVTNTPPDAAGGPG